MRRTTPPPAPAAATSGATTARTWAAWARGRSTSPPRPSAPATRTWSTPPTPSSTPAAACRTSTSPHAAAGRGPPRPAPRAGSRLELVAEAANRDDVARRGRLGFHLGAQPLHVDVQSLGVADVIGTPDTVDELAAGEHPARIAQQQLEQLELLQRQLHRRPVDGDHVAFDVHPDRPGGQCRRGDLGGVGALPAQYGPDARDQLAR